MGSIVLDLQSEALNGKVPVSDLLRKALVVARKLGQKDFQSWIENEIGGYKKGVEIPYYRIIKGQLKGHNPMRGWMPVIFEHPEMAEMASTTGNVQGISSLETLMEQRTPKSFISSPVSEEVQGHLNRMIESGFPTTYQVFIQYSQVKEIIENVRAIILNWTLKLEEEKIFGEGMTFTKTEKHQAGSSVFNNVNNFYGSVESSQFQQGSPYSVQLSAPFNLDTKLVKEFLEKLTKSLPNLGLEKEKVKEAEAEVVSIKAQLGSPKPKSGIVKEGLSSLKTIIESATAAVIAQPLLVELAKIFPVFLKN